MCKIRMDGRILTDVIAAPWRLNLDHLRAHVRQNHRCERPSNEVGKISHPDARQRLWGVCRSRGMRREFRFETIQHLTSPLPYLRCYVVGERVLMLLSC